MLCDTYCIMLCIMQFRRPSTILVFHNKSFHYLFEIYREVDLVSVLPHLIHYYIELILSILILKVVISSGQQ